MNGKHARKLWLGWALVCVVLGAPHATRAEDDPPLPERGIDTKAFLEALGKMLDGADWKPAYLRQTRRGLRRAAANTPAPHDESYGRGFLEGHWMLAGSRLLGGLVQAEASVFASDDDAKAYLAARRARVKDEGEIVASTRGAGPRSRYDGLYVEQRSLIGSQTKHLLRKERLYVYLTVLKTPELTRAVQDRFLAHALRTLQPDGAKVSVPKGVDWDASRPMRTVVVRVVDPDGVPVPRARVWLSARRGGPHALEGKVIAGRAAIRFPHIVGKVRVMDPQTESGEPLPLATAERDLAKDETEITVRLRFGATLEGTLFESDGAPAADVRVVAGKDHGSAFFTHHGEATTGTDGRFRIVGLDAGTYTLQVHRPKQMIRLTGTQEAKTDTPNQVFRLAKTGSIRVRLLGPDGEPVPGVLSVVGESWGVEANEQGEATLSGLEVGRPYTIRARPGTSRPHLARTTFVRATGKDVYTIKFDAGWTLRGVVQDAKGRPLAARVQRKDDPHRDHLFGPGFTDREGVFELHGLPQRPVQVRAVPLDMRGLQARELPWVTVRPTEDEVTLRVERPPTLTVRVIGPDGEPIPEFWLHVGTERHARGVLARAGLGQVSRPASPFRVHVCRATGEHGEPLDLAPYTREGLSADDEELTVRLVPGHQLRGRVVDEAGEPLQGVKIEARQRPIGRAHDEATTSDDGAFRLRNLGRGAYRLHITPRAPHRPTSREVRVGDDEPIEIRLRLKDD